MPVIRLAALRRDALVQTRWSRSKSGLYFALEGGFPDRLDQASRASVSLTHLHKDRSRQLTRPSAYAYDASLDFHA